MYVVVYNRLYFCYGDSTMGSIRFSEDVRPLSEFRANAAAFVEQVQTTHRPIVLTQRGRSAAVLLDVGEYERLVERVEVLDDIRVAEEQIARGEGIEHEKAKAEVLARLGR
jgi:antitoxin YefM